MPEISNNAAILIATSYQALNRARSSDKSAMLCNNSVTILFVAFFIEENLDVIINGMGHYNEMLAFYNDGARKKRYLGLLDKMAWFFNRHVALQPRAKSELFKKDANSEPIILKDIEKYFQGFKKIYKFRNDVSHGKIFNRLTLEETEKMRLQAKVIVDNLLKIAESKEYPIPRVITYWMAIKSDKEQVSEDKV